MNPSLIRKLEGLIERHEEVQALLGEPGVASDQDRYRALTREYAQLEDIVHAFQRYRQAQDDLETTQMMLEEDDADLREMAQEELPLAAQPAPGASPTKPACCAPDTTVAPTCSSSGPRASSWPPPSPR